jgi:hypothetical protein
MPYRYPPEFRRRVLDLLAAGTCTTSRHSDPSRTRSVPARIVYKQMSRNWWVKRTGAGSQT